MYTVNIIVFKWTPNGSRYQATKTNSKKLYQKQCRAGSQNPQRWFLPTTNHQCLGKPLLTINGGISGSYISELDKTVFFRTIGQSMPTNQQATTTSPTKQGRTNGQCTGNTLYSPGQHPYFQLETLVLYLHFFFRVKTTILNTKYVLTKTNKYNVYSSASPVSLLLTSSLVF